MRKRRKFITTEDAPEDMALQITSMADIFTIILVFLLKSFSTGMANITPMKGNVLPAISITAKEEMKEALRVEITPNAILVDQKQVMELWNFRFTRAPAAEYNILNNRPIPVVVEALQSEREKDNDRKALRAGDPEKSGQLMVLAHEKTPYSTLKAVMDSAASAGFGDLQLVVLGKN